MITAKIVTEPFEAQIGNDFKIIAKTITDSEGNSLNLDTSFFEIEWKDAGGITYLMRHDPNGENLNCKVECGVLQMIFDKTKYRFRYPDLLSYRVHTRSYDPDMFDGAFDIWTLPQKSNIRLTVGSSLFGYKTTCSHMEMPYNYQKGDKGDQGEKGEKGDPFYFEDFTTEQLNKIKGKDGVTPVKGVDYFDGENGVNGLNGNDGLSAYDYAVKGGYEGTENQFSEEQATIANNSQRLKMVEQNKQDKPSSGRSFLTPLFVTRGAVFNNKTGYYELNGLTDITEAQMMTIYNESNNCQSSANSCFSLFYMNNMVTNFVPVIGDFTPWDAGTYNAVNCRAMFRGCRNIKVVNLGVKLKVNSATYLFLGCLKLKTVLGIIDLSAHEQSLLVLIFGSCFLLESVNVFGLKFSISFADSPNLTRDSILYLINNSINTAVITVALHETAKTKLTDEDIALAASKNITIA